MFARSLALFAVLSTSAIAVEPPVRTIAVYLKPGTADAAALAYMKRELANLMDSAGYATEWLEAPAIPDVRGASLLVLELEGACLAGGGASDSRVDLGVESLASTPVSGGEILPFSTLHCDALNRVIGKSIAAAAAASRPWLYGRAMARLAAHELYHVLSDTRGHSREGIAKARFSAADLMADRFEFESSALAKMRLAGATEAAAGPVATRESTGR